MGDSRWNPNLTGNSAWLEEFMHRHQLSKQVVAQILGENQARPCEWLKQIRPFPDEARHRLQQWEAGGCPRFPYWRDPRPAA